MIDVSWWDAEECTMESGTWTDVYGIVHENAVHINAASSGNGTWNLNGAYTKITGVLAAGEEAYNEETAVHVEILADGEKIITTPCRILAEQGNALELPHTRFVSWKDFFSELGESLEPAPEASPIPPGFFTGLSVPVVSLSGRDDIEDYLEERSRTS